MRKFGRSAPAVDEAISKAAYVSTYELITHWISIKLAPSNLAIVGNDTETILESSTISEDTRDAVRSNGNFAPVWPPSGTVTALMNKRRFVCEYGS